MNNGNFHNLLPDQTGKDSIPKSLQRYRDSFNEKELNRIEHLFIQTHFFFLAIGLIIVFFLLYYVPIIKFVDYLIYDLIIRHTTNTLLANLVITEIPAILLLLIMLLIGVGSLILYFYASNTISILFTLALSTVYIAASGFFLIYMNMRLPIIPILITQYGVLLISSLKKVSDGEKIVSEILVNLSKRLYETIFPTDFFLVENYWKYIIVMIEQVLSLKRSIFLENISGYDRVIEIESLHCSLEDIQEKRRKYTRMPYSTAIKENNLIEVKNYFKNTKDDEMEFLIPFVFEKQVLGFWAFTVTHDHFIQDPKFKEVIKMYADEIARLLYQRQIYNQYTSKNIFWKKLFSFKNTRQLFGRLYRSFAIFEKELINLDSIFYRVNSAAIYYDLFGKVLKINNRMIDILRQENIRPFEVTIIELIKTLTKSDPIESRRYMEEIILQHQPRLIPIKLEKAKLSGYIKIQILKEQSSRVEETGIATPFTLSGILLEIIEVHENKE